MKGQPCAISFGIEGIANRYCNEFPEDRAYYASRGSLIEVEGDSYGILPGMLELSQRLHSDDRISRLFCFSSGAFSRNGLFWVELLRQSLPRKKFRAVLKETRIFSSEDLCMAVREKSIESYKKFQTEYSEQRKRLQLLVGEKHFKNTLHIDYQRGCIYPGEEGNVLITSSSMYTPRAVDHEEPETLWYSANRVCYIAGLIFTCMQNASQRSISLPKALFQIQYRPNPEEGTFNPIYSELMEDRTFYERGLSELRKVNLGFKFETADPSSDEGNLNSETLFFDEMTESFKDLWQQNEYIKAVEIIDNMLDLIERKSGRWITSSRQVCNAIVPIIVDVCNPYLSPQQALLLFPRIMDIPLYSQQTFCWARFLNALPQGELKKEYLVKCATAFWDERKHGAALQMLSTISSISVLDENFLVLETAFDEICRCPIPKEHHPRLLEIARQISAEPVKVQCLNHLLLGSTNDYQKFTTLCSLATANVKIGNTKDALMHLDKAIEIENQIGILHQDFKLFESLREAVTAFETVGTKEIESLTSFVEKIKNKVLKNILLAHCYSFFEIEKKFSEFQKLAKESFSFKHDEQYRYILTTGIKMIEEDLTVYEQPIEEAISLLMFLLETYNYRKSRLSGDRFSVSLIRELESKSNFEMTKTFLCSLPFSNKKASVLSGLSRIYWWTKQHKSSLNLISEILNEAPTIETEKNYLVEPILFSLLYFQSRNCCRPKNYKEMIDSNLTGITKAMADAIFSKIPGGSKQAQETKLTIAVSALELWYLEKKNKAVIALQELLGPELLDSQLLYFVINEMCLMDTPTHELTLLASEIPHLELRAKALKACASIDKEYQFHSSWLTKSPS